MDHKEKEVKKNYTPTKPTKSSLTLEENQDVKFNLSKLEMVVEGMTHEINQELDGFKDDILSIKMNISNDLGFLHTFISST